MKIETFRFPELEITERERGALYALFEMERQAFKASEALEDLKAIGVSLSVSLIENYNAANVALDLLGHPRDNLHEYDFMGEDENVNYDDCHCRDLAIDIFLLMVIEKNEDDRFIDAMTGKMDIPTSYRDDGLEKFFYPKETP